MFWYLIELYLLIIGYLSDSKEAEWIVSVLIILVDVIHAWVDKHRR